MPKRIPTQQQAATAAKINAIRAQARGITPEQLGELACPTCGRAAESPYRGIVLGTIAEGCVDAHHHGRTCSGESTEWHTRPEAARIRREELRSLESLGIKAPYQTLRAR